MHPRETSCFFKSAANAQQQLGHIAGLFQNIIRAQAHAFGSDGEIQEVPDDDQRIDPFILSSIIREHIAKHTTYSDEEVKTE